MTVESDDQDLRARFHELREEVTASVPPFVVRPVPTTKRLPLLWTLAALGATTIVAVLLWTSVFQTGQASMPGIDLSLVAWTAPSDYLLETPGNELLRTLPKFDVADYTVQSSDPGFGVADTSS
jgi:hypothetical protein